MENKKPGRKKIYQTPEEKNEANRIKAQRYYEKNKEQIQIRNLKRYYKNKLDNENV